MTTPMFPLLLVLLSCLQPETKFEMLRIDLRYLQLKYAIILQRHANSELGICNYILILHAIQQENRYQAITILIYPV